MTDFVSDPREALARWRLLLGRYAQERLETPLRGEQARVDRALDFLYGREHAGRGVRRGRSGGAAGRGGTLDPTQLDVPEWLAEVRRLFPRPVLEVLERDALQRYDLQELVTDPETLTRLEPNLALVQTLMSFRGRLGGRVLDEARRIIHQVVDELTRRLEQEIRRAFSGRIDRFRQSRLKVAQNLDWRRTVRANLRHWDPETRRLAVRDLRFFARVRRHIPWTIVLCVDQSGSMAGSVVYSAVVAAILSRLPAVSVRLVLFDTSVVDVSDRVDDPLEVLLGVQLGGGTDIGRALRYCEGLVDNPRRTVLVLISDFDEGASPRVLLATVRRLAEAGVMLRGLAGLDEESTPFYDRRMAERLVAHGMEVAAATPGELARWLASTIR
ncbi:MAG: VWA domain-containing protein [Acidobacteriota bacterium]